MRGRLLPAGALAAFALLAAPLASGDARPGAGHPALSARAARLQVTEVEYRLILSQGVVRAGPVDLAAIDRGIDPHDLRLRGGGSGWGPEVAVPQLASQQRWDGVVYLRPGTYRLWCSLPEHARLGMHAVLRVVR